MEIPDIYGRYHEKGRKYENIGPIDYIEKGLKLEYDY